MPSLQIRDLPDHIYHLLATKAEENRRSLAQQAIIELERMVEAEARSRRLEVIREIRAELAANGVRETMLNPATLVREDRER